MTPVVYLYADEQLRSPTPADESGEGVVRPSPAVRAAQRGATSVAVAFAMFAGAADHILPEPVPMVEQDLAGPLPPPVRVVFPHVYTDTEGLGQPIALGEEVGGPADIGACAPYIEYLQTGDDLPGAVGAVIDDEYEPPRSGPVLRAPTVTLWAADEELPGAVGPVVDEYDHPIQRAAHQPVALYQPPHQDEIASGVPFVAEPARPTLPEPVLRRPFTDVLGADEVLAEPVPIVAEEDSPTLHVVARPPFVAVLGAGDVGSGAGLDLGLPYTAAWVDPERTASWTDPARLADWKEE